MIRRHTAWVLARILLGLLLVYMVARQIHFQDHLVLRDGQKVVPGETEMWGRIVEETKNSVTFRVEGTTEDRIVPQSAIAEGGVRKGALSLVHDLSPGFFLLSFAALGAGWLITVIRWRILTAARGIPIPFWEAFRLTYIGFFFSNVIPGATGGDIVKAYLAARGRTQKTDMAVSVFVDRIIGLIAMAFVAGIAILFHLGDPRFRKLALAVTILLALSVAGAFVFFSRRMRRLLFVDRLLDRLPGQNLLQEIDRAVFLYRYHRGAVLAAFGLSFINLFFLIANNALLGLSLGAPVGIWNYVIFAPVASIVTAIPLLPAGWGLGEMAYSYLFLMVRASDTAGVTLSVLMRSSTVLWSLLGGIFFMVEKASGRGAGSVDSVNPNQEPSLGV